MTDVTIATEALDLDEGQSAAALRRTLAFLTRKIDPSTELILAVTNPDHAELKPIVDAFPQVRVHDCRGLKYDTAKMQVARAAKGDIIAFLDGDCVPMRDDWLARLLAPIRAGRAVCASGLTRYEGGFFAKLLSILDFGFLYEVDDGAPVGCYVSNNCAMRRDVLLGSPIPDGDLRCNCYYHAQQMLAKGTPFVLAADAVVEHEVPAFFKERWRRGADFVGETKENAALPAARSSASRLVSAWRIYRENLDRDRQRLPRASRLFEFSNLEETIARLSFPALRAVDLVATFVALRQDDGAAPQRAGARSAG